MLKESENIDQLQNNVIKVLHLTVHYLQRRLWLGGVLCVKRS